MKEPEPTAAAALTTSAPATASSGFLRMRKSPVRTAAAALTTSATAAASSGISSKVNEARRRRGKRRRSARQQSRPRLLPANYPSKKSARARPQVPPEGRGAPHALSVPKQHSFPPLLSGAAFSGDTQLSAAWEALDTKGRSRLTREDFVSAMGTAREVLSRRPTGEARFLDAYTRAGVAYADGRTAEAWQLLSRALQNAGARGRHPRDALRRRRGAARSGRTRARTRNG